MKSNKIIVLTTLAVGSLIACGSAFGGDTASTPNSMTPNATSHASNMTKGSGMDTLAQKLDLTDSQKKQVESIFGSTREQMRDVHENTSLSADQKRSEFSKIRDGLNTKLQSVLTPQQYAKWEDITRPHRTMSSGSPAGSPP